MQELLYGKPDIPLMVVKRTQKSVFLNNKEVKTIAYIIQLEIAGDTAMWTRPDTGDNPVSYPAPHILGG